MPNLHLLQISPDEFLALPDGAMVLIYEYGQWLVVKKRKRSGYLGGVKGFWLLPKGGDFNA